MSPTLADSVTILILGLVTGGFLGQCFGIWRAHGKQLTESQWRYLRASIAVGSAVFLWMLASFVIAVVEVFHILS